MKKIAITQRLIKNEAYYEIREALDINYCEFIFDCGFLPIIIPYEIDFKTLFNELKIDGVLLSGGNDLFSCSHNELSKKRDKFEKQLLEHCILNNIPVLGICRGMQIIAEYFGSTFEEVEGEINTRGRIIANKSSKYYDNLKHIKEVNSYHKFDIKNVSDELLISAKNIL